MERKANGAFTLKGSKVYNSLQDDMTRTEFSNSYKHQHKRQAGWGVSPPVGISHRDKNTKVAVWSTFLRPAAHLLVGKWSVCVSWRGRGEMEVKATLSVCKSKEC